jgi:hypothetical protein
MRTQTWHSVGMIDTIEWNDGVVTYQRDSGATHLLADISGDLITFCCSGLPFCLDDVETIVNQYNENLTFEEVNQYANSVVSVLLQQNLIESIN